MDEKSYIVNLESIGDLMPVFEPVIKTPVVEEVKEPEIDIMEGLEELPYLSLRDHNKKSYPFCYDDDASASLYENDYVFTGVIENGKVVFVIHDDRDYKIPNRFHTNYGYVLIGEARDIFHVVNPKNVEIRDEKRTTYYIDEKSSLEYVGGDKYSYTIHVRLNKRERGQNNALLTITAIKHDYVYYVDNIFQDWVDSATGYGFEEDLRKQPKIEPRKSVLEDVFKDW